jgi:hypothetical protein
MAVIQNKWVKSERTPKAQSKEQPKHTPTLCRATMHKSLRGVRK